MQDFEGVNKSRLFSTPFINKDCFYYLSSAGSNFSLYKCWFEENGKHQTFTISESARSSDNRSLAVYQDYIFTIIGAKLFLVKEATSNVSQCNLGISLSSSDCDIYCFENSLYIYNESSLYKINID